MDDFDTVEYFNTANETICFGTRCFSDGDSLYETATLCVLKRNEEIVIDAQPEIHSCVYNGQLIFTIGKSIRIFDDLDCTSLIFNAKLEETIDNFCIYCNHILVCLRNGNVVLIDIQSLNIVTNVSVVQNVWLKDQYFVHIFADESSPSDQLRFILTTKKGILYKISIDLNGDESNRNVVETVFNFDRTVTCAVRLNRVLALGGSDLVLYDLANNKCDVTIDGIKLKEIYACHPKKFIALTEENTVILICSSTGLYFDLFPEEDNCTKILFYQDELKNSICLLLSDAGDNGNCLLKAINMCDMSVIYSLTLKHEAVCSLVYPQNFCDSQIYLSQFGDQEIRVKVVYEAMPEKRLERLLRGRKFDEAEQFAKQFSLNLVDVKKARANVIATKEMSSSEDVDRLIAILSEIDDIDFKYLCCHNVSCDNFDDIRKIITYALDLDPKENASNDVMSRVCYFNEIIQKLDTYSVLCKHNDTEPDFINWKDFSTCDLYDYLCENLACGQFEISSILYSRMDRNCIKDLGGSDISKIMNLLNKYSHDDYFPFLLTFMDKTFSYNPAMIHNFVEWIQERIFFIECDDFDNFPENGIEFIDKMLNCISNIGDGLKDQRGDILGANGKCNYEELNAIIKCLKIIQTLKNNYMIIVPLKNCFQGTSELIHVLMNCDIADIDEFIKNFLIGYIIENKLSPDDVFMDEIDQLIEEEEESVWINTVPYLWKHISSMELKLKAILLILKYAKLPWCAEVKQMAYGVLDYKHRLVQQIEFELKREPLYIVWNKDEYKLKHLPIQQVDNYFAFMKIIESEKESVQEDLYTLSADSEAKALANTLLLDSYVRKKDIAKALSFISKQSADDLLAHVDKTICYCQVAKSSDQYVNIMEPFINKACNSDAIKTWDKHLYSNFAHRLKAICYLNKNYGMHLETSSIATAKQREEILEHVLSLLVGDLEDESTGIVEIVQSCRKVAWALSKEPEQVIVKLCREFVDIALLTKCAKSVYYSSTDSKVLCQMATLILRNVGNQNHEFTSEFDFSMIDDGKSRNKLDCQLIITCLELAKKMATKALLHANDLEIVEVFNWAICTCNCLEESESSESSFVYKESVSLGVVYAMKEIFSIYTNFLSTNYSSMQMDYFNQPIVENKISLKQSLVTRIPVIIQGLCSEGKLLHACRFLLILQNSQLSLPEERQILANFVWKCNKLLIQKILTRRSIDIGLAFNLLLFYDYSKATYILKQAFAVYKRDVDKFKILADLGIKLCKYHDMCGHKEYKMYYEIVLLIKWWKSLKVNAIAYKDFFTMTKDDLLKSLLVNNYLSVQEMIDFAKEFSLKIEPYYYTYLENILINWKPVWTIDLDIKQKKFLNLENSNLLEKSKEIIQLIPEKEQVFNFVNNLLPKVNVYHYEVFICIYKIISILNPTKNISQKLCLLQFLQIYTRISKPSTSEREEWFTQFPNTQKIDALSELRLPCTSTLYTKEIWNILRNEINLNNYLKWFKILPMMNDNLNKDDICSYVVKNVATSDVLKSRDAVAWNLHPKHVRLFEEIDACIQHISNLERATSVAYHIFNNTPPGADQVNAARLSYKYAKLYKEANHREEEREAVHKAFIKVKSKYQCYSTMHILYTNNLAKDEYLSFVSQPNELIEALYLDERITHKAAVLYNPDINRVVDEIANIYGINIAEIRKKILDQLFTGDQYFGGNMDDSFTFMNTNVDKDDKENNYLTRASYICLSSDVTFWQQYLSSKGIHDDSKTVPYKYQARILKCFSVISDDETIEQLTHTDRASLIDFINKLFILHDLQSLGIDLTMGDMDNYKEVLKRLSKIANNQLGLRVMASICKVFQVSDIKPWQFITYNMIKLKMYDDIHDCLEHLAENGIPQIKFYIDAWQTVVDNLFNPSNVEDTDKLYIQKLKTLQSCDVVYRLSLEVAFHKCIELKRTELSAIILQYFLDDSTQSRLTNIILKTQSKESLVKAISNLESYGLQGTSYVIKLINSY